MKNTSFYLGGLLTLSLLTAGRRPPELPFTKATLDLGSAETAAFADVNGDGKLDIVCGEFWYQNPTWKKTQFRELNFDNNYIDAFSDLAIDVDGDGKTDIVTATYFQKKLSWYKNPGKPGAMWAETVIDTAGSIEFAFLVDLDNDGKAREIVLQYGGKVPTYWFGLKDGKWIRHMASAENQGHGIGMGDVNKDGRNDILTPMGWLEAPANREQDNWAMHKSFPAQKSLSFMHVLDINGDGRNDIVAGNAHDYGLFWLEQKADGGFESHMIDDSYSQPHTVTMADLNKDGKPDFLTGKRFMAHNGRDPGEREPLGIYWYEFEKDATAKIQWTKHVVEFSTRTGTGMQMPVADLNGDGKLDFATPGKSGLFVFMGGASSTGNPVSN